ncbi:hypothetical protein K504DRAFT_384019 [Pleomassaria siparia CBS 279.74]|uniref:Uncharacterized protein n=1 Tax=Pleomassaria siparia CBS 279.74 TaxID=1314801 RepID=A0A6G1K4G8_9PLEO|nr:hypothetical protein K504DRAFT_384019 [Pleomassaria siparia CBS 279.74]
MPADRRTMPTSNKPVKTERTHEENQERDRSLEARIESARRASEIHKKRTGRGLRVTEQDVVNEEMYEEEDEDLPTQYQRLSAHLHTGSLQFNRKLHDYIATQHGVRNAFLQQYQNPPFPGYGPQVPYTYPQMQNSLVGQHMLPPHMFNPTTMVNNQSAPPTSPPAYQQSPQGYRQAPYSIPQRTNLHQRLASIPSPKHGFRLSEQQFAPADTPLGDQQRRMSLPSQPSDQSTYQAKDDTSRPPLSRSTTSKSAHQQSVSPQNDLGRASASPRSAHGTPPSHPHQENPPTSAFPFKSMDYTPSSQVLHMDPLSMSLPSESQQFMGNILDPNDPRTLIFMSGSEFLQHPFAKYTYNPNLASKVSRSDNSTTTNGTTTPAMTPIKLETNMDIASLSDPHSATSDGFVSSAMFSPPTFLDFPTNSDGSEFAHGNGEQGLQDDFDDNAFTNAFINPDAWT